MRPARDRIESDEETDLCTWAKANGWRVYKVQFPGRRGAPDRLFGHKVTKRRLFVECKKHGERPTEQQEIVHEELREIGFEVAWVDNAADGIRVLAQG